MNVVVDLDNQTYWKLAGVAEREGMKTSDMLRNAASDLADGERVNGSHWRDAQEKALVVFVAANWTDAAIAAALGFSRGAISTRRRLLGIRRSSRPGRPTRLELERRSA